MNTHDVQFGGVTLPRGSLFTLGEDGGLAFLRFTPFMFDTRAEMISAFGTEVIKAEEGGENLELVVRKLKGWVPRERLESVLTILGKDKTPEEINQEIIIRKWPFIIPEDQMREELDVMRKLQDLK